MAASSKICIGWPAIPIYAVTHAQVYNPDARTDNGEGICYQREKTTVNLIGYS